MSEEDDVVMIVDDDDDDDDEDDLILSQTSDELGEMKKAQGNIMYQKKLYSSALGLYTEAIDLCPTVASYYNNRCACYMMMHRYRDALEDARKSIELDQHQTKAYVRMLKCAIALGDLLTGEQATRHLTVIDPTSAELHTIQQMKQYEHDAQMAHQKNDYRKTVFCMDRLLEYAPTCLRYKITKAENLTLLERYKDAQMIVNDILHVDRAHADAIYVRGMCLYYEDQMESALKHFQQVSRLAPDHQKAPEMYRKAKELNRLKEDGNKAYKECRFSQALDLYTHALQVDAQHKCANAKLFFNRATVHHRLGDPRSALSDCNSALLLDGQYLKALLRRATCYTQLELYEEAVQDYETVCKFQKTAEHMQLLQNAKIALKRSKRKDYYKILEVAKDATDVDIKKAYRKRALLLHPDRHSNATEAEKADLEVKFKELGEAYGVLTDANKKAKYDSGQDLDDFEAGFDPHQMFQTFACNGSRVQFSMNGFPTGFFSFG